MGDNLLWILLCGLLLWVLDGFSFVMFYKEMESYRETKAIGALWVAGLGLSWFLMATICMAYMACTADRLS